MAGWMQPTSPTDQLGPSLLRIDLEAMKNFYSHLTIYVLSPGMPGIATVAPVLASPTGRLTLPLCKYYIVSKENEM